MRELSLFFSFAGMLSSLLIKKELKAMRGAEEERKLKECLGDLRRGFVYRS